MSAVSTFIHLMLFIRNFMCDFFFRFSLSCQFWWLLYFGVPFIPFTPFVLCLLSIAISQCHRKHHLNFIFIENSDLPTYRDTRALIGNIHIHNMKIGKYECENLFQLQRCFVCQLLSNNITSDASSNTNRTAPYQM